MAYHLKVITETPLRLHPQAIPPGARFRTQRLGFACALVRAGLAEPATPNTQRDVELGIRLQDIARPNGPTRYATPSRNTARLAG